MKKNETNYEADIKSFSAILITILIFLGVFYGIAYLITYKPEEKVDLEPPVTSIQYDNILAGEIKNFDGNYLVYVPFKDENEIMLYDQYVNSYSSKEESMKVYRVDIENAFNKSYVSETSKLDVQDLSELKFSKTTILEVKDGKIVNTYEGKEKIVEKMKSLIN